MPFEPDFNHVALMLNLDQLGRYAIDSSGFGNRGKISGAGYVPQIIKDDGIDLGYGENSQYMYFDGRFVYVFIEDNPNLRASKINNYISITCRIYLFPDSWEPCDPTDPLKARYICSKSDDNHQQFGYALALTPDGRIKFTWSKAGTKSTVQTPIATITSRHPGYTKAGYSPSGFDIEDLTVIDTTAAIAVFNIAIIADVQEGYDSDGFDVDSFETGPSGGIKIAVDSAFLTNSPVPVITYYNESTTDHLDLIVGNTIDLPDDIDDPNANEHLPLVDENLRLRIGAAFPLTGDQQKFYKFKGGIQNFHIYRELLLGDIDLRFLFSNKLSISPIPFGKVAKAGYTLLLPTAQGDAGYDPTGFDSIGFDTGI